MTKDLIGFSERLKGLRFNAQLTQEDVAKRVKCARGTYAQYENGTRTPDAKVVKSLAELFDVSADYLIFGTERKEENIPGEVQMWFRADGTGLTSEEIELLKEDLSDYFMIRKKRLLDRKKRI